MKLEIRELPNHQHRQARRIAQKYIDCIPKSWINDDPAEKLRKIRSHLLQGGFETKIHLEWTEAISDGQRLGVLLQTSNVSNLALPDQIRKGDPRWMNDYIQQIRMIDLMAVEDTHRHQGVGTELFRDAIERARNAGIKRVLAGSTSHESAMFLESQGMTVGELGRPLPSKINNGFELIIRPHQRSYARWCWMDIN